MVFRHLRAADLWAQQIGQLLKITQSVGETKQFGDCIFMVRSQPIVRAVKRHDRTEIPPSATAGRDPEHLGPPLAAG